MTEKLTLELVKEHWSKPYDENHKPSWKHIYKYYDKNVVFKDSIQVVHGLELFMDMSNRLTKRCKSLEMDLQHVVMNDNVIMMDWKMTMKFRFFPSSPVYGSTVLTLNEDGQITHQRDYYDLWGDIADGVPIFRRIYRWFMKVFFG